MFCTKCGNKINSNSKFCPKCGNEINQVQVNNTYTNNTNQTTQGSISADYALAAAIILLHLLIFISPSLIFLNVIIVPILYLIGLILMFAIKSKNPQDKHSKTLMYIYIGLGILVILEIVFVIMSISQCIYAFTHCSG